MMFEDGGFWQALMYDRPTEKPPEYFLKFAVAMICVSFAVFILAIITALAITPLTTSDLFTLSRPDFCLPTHSIEMQIMGVYEQIMVLVSSAGIIYGYKGLMAVMDIQKNGPR